MGMELTHISRDERIQGANNMVEKMKNVKEEAAAALKAAADDMKRFYDANQ